MKIKKTPFVPALAAVFILCACGDGQPAQPKGPISEDRTAAFKSMMPEFVSMRKMVKGDEVYQVEKFKQAAAVFAENSKKPFEHFQSDPQGNGEALPAIWQNPEKFKVAEEKFRAAVEKLNEKAQGGNLEEITAASGVAAARGMACHDSFRMKE